MNKYKLTPKIIENIAIIQRLYGQLEALHLPRELQLNLERNNLIQSSYISNSIEGNPLSFPEVSNLLLDDRIPANRSEKEIKNYFSVLKSLEYRASEDLGINEVLKIHKDLIGSLDDDIAGKFRNKRIVVGRRVLKEGEYKLRVKHEPPYHDIKKIKESVNQLLKWLKTSEELPLLKISLFHHQYVYIHPFADGNGRTVRLLTALLFLKAGYEINKYFVLDDFYDLDRKTYSDALHTADSGDSTEWIEYFTDGIKYSLSSSLAKSKNALSTLNVTNRPTVREEEVMALFVAPDFELTTSDVASSLNVSRQQAQNLLASLVAKGLVEKFGSTKASYYKIKN